MKPLSHPSSGPWHIREDASGWFQPPTLEWPLPLYPRHLGLLSWTPRHFGVETNHPCCVLTHRPIRILKWLFYTTEFWDGMKKFKVVKSGIKRLNNWIETIYVYFLMDLQTHSIWGTHVRVLWLQETNSTLTQVKKNLLVQYGAGRIQRNPE